MDEEHTGPRAVDRHAEKVSAWEIAGVPAAGVFYAAYRLGWLEAMGWTAEELPEVMLMGYVVAALVRALGRKVLEVATKRFAKG
jgi:hypothetical protein